MRKLKPRKDKKLFQGHPSRMWQSCNVRTEVSLVSDSGFPPLCLTSTFLLKNWMLLWVNVVSFSGFLNECFLAFGVPNPCLCLSQLPSG